MIVMLIFVFGVSVLGSRDKVRRFKSTIILERVEVFEQDPAAVQAVTFTSRAKRRDPYKTNATVSILQQMGNNVTMIIYYKNSKTTVEQVFFTTDLCDVMKMPWMMKLVTKYSDIPERCPLVPGEYHITNFELKPKEIPLPFPSGEHYIGIILRRKNSQVVIHFIGSITVKH